MYPVDEYDIMYSRYIFWLKGLWTREGPCLPPTVTFTSRGSENTVTRYLGDRHDFCWR